MRQLIRRMLFLTTTFKRAGVSILCMVFCLASTAASNAQDITADGVARSASRFAALITHCQKSSLKDVEGAKRIQQVFINVGVKAYGKEKFEKLLAAATKTQNMEVAKAGASRWCASQKDLIQDVNDGVMFDKPAPKSKTTIDQMATILASYMIAEKSCGMKTKDVNLSEIVAKRGFDVKDFTPNGAHGSLVGEKIDKAKEFVATLGPEKACEGIADVVRKYLPEVVR